MTNKATIVVVGLGPADRDLITKSAHDALAGDHVYLRTRKHPAAQPFTNAVSFDDVYDSAERIEDVYPEIVERLVAAAQEHGRIVYAVPGSPLVAEATVVGLRARSDVDVSIIAALSFLDLCWQELGVDPLDVSPRIVDGRAFAVEAAGERGPMLVAQCDQQWVLSDIKLAYENETPDTVTVLQRLGSPDQAVFTLPWEDLDRSVEPDERTSLWIENVPSPVAMELSRLDSVSQELRVRCPWDAKQTHASLSKHLIEESYEAVEAMNGDDDDHLIEELGDVLFQVFAHSTIATQQGRFTVGDVAKAVTDKLVERHPHVYGDESAATADEVVKNWEVNKMSSKGRSSAMEGIPADLPSLMYASKVLSRAKAAGFVESASTESAQELGDVLLRLVAQAAEAGQDPEVALRMAFDRYRERFLSYEQRK